MSSPAQGGAPQTINISDLDIQQLTEVKKQLEDELNHLTSSFAQLKQAQSKFKACVENVAELTPQNKDKTILVPLTNSLYVPGKLLSTEHVIIDVGTGYYVKKNRKEATKHYTSKIDYIQTNLNTLESTIQRKRDNISMVVQVLQSKVTAQIQSQEGSKRS